MLLSAVVAAVKYNPPITFHRHKKTAGFTAGSLKYGWVTFVISSIIIKSRFSVKTEPDKSIKKEGGMCEEIVNFL